MFKALGVIIWLVASIAMWRILGETEMSAIKKTAMILFAPFVWAAIISNVMFDLFIHDWFKQ
jgi:hypothetical protein